MLKIRLRKIGKGIKKRYHFRIGVAEARQARDGRVIEDIGYYDPSKNPPLFFIKKDRFKYWVQHGAQPSKGLEKLLKHFKIKKEG